jgi:hypothetical protein
MNNLSKYRKLSVLAVIILVITWLSAMAAFWNYKVDAKNAGWVVVFMGMVIIPGILLFAISYFSIDPSKIEIMRKDAYESGKSDMLQDFESKKQTAHDQQVKDEDMQKIVDAVLSGINSVRSESGLCNKLLTGLSREMGFVQGVMYIRKGTIFNPSGVYALTDRKPESFKEGETLAGQAVANKSITIIHDIPEKYFSISSGLGNSSPRYLLLVPAIYNNEIIAVLELAAFTKPDESTEKLLEKILSEASSKINKFITAS